MLWNSIQIFSVPLDCIYLIWIAGQCCRYACMSMCVCDTKFGNKAWGTMGARSGGGWAKGALALPLKFEKVDVIRHRRPERQPGFESACRRFCRKMILWLCYTKYAYLMFGFYWVRHLHKADTPLIGIHDIRIVRTYMHLCVHTCTCTCTCTCIWLYL